MTPTPNVRLHLARLTTRNLLSVEDSTIDLTDGVNVFVGRNESGKTTRMKAIRRTLGLDRATLVSMTPVDAKDGDQPPTVEMLLLGDDTEIRIKRVGDGNPQVRVRQGEAWTEPKRPVEFLNRLVDSHAALPALWLLADDEKRATMLLEACKLEGYDRDAMMAEIGMAGFQLPRIPGGLHPLEELKQIEEVLRASRTAVGREEDTQQAAGVALLKDLPAETPGDVEAAIAQLDAMTRTMADDIARDRSTHKARVAADRTRIVTDEQRRVTEARSAHGTRVAEIKAEADRQLAAATIEMEQALSAIQRETAVQLEAVDRDTAIVLPAIETKDRVLARDREELAGLRKQQESIQTDRTVRRMAADAQAKAEDLHEQYVHLTNALEALSTYRLNLAAQLPIKGLEVQFDERGRKKLTHNGKPSEHWSEGEAAKLAMEYALLGSGAPEDGRPYLPIILLDRAGDLSPARRSALLREVAARGAQVIAAVTEESDFQVLRGEDAMKVEAA